MIFSEVWTNKFMSVRLCLKFLQLEMLLTGIIKHLEHMSSYYFDSVSVCAVNEDETLLPDRMMMNFSLGQSVGHFWTNSQSFSVGQSLSSD